MFFKNINEINCQLWLKKTLTSLPKGARLLDAGAGELKNHQYCGHLSYVSQDFCQYQGAGGGGQMKVCRLMGGTPRALTWSATLPLSPRQMPASMPSSAAKCWSTCPNPPMRSMNSPACSNPVA